MARHSSGAADVETLRTKPASKRERRAEAARARRLAEREQVSGEIRTPKAVTAARARRRTPSAASSSESSSADSGERRQEGDGPRRTPVSAQTAVPERTFSGRMIVLTVVALVVISFLVPTVRTYFQQRAEISELEAEIAAEEHRQAELETEIARWEDPEFVRQQARERINLVMPGERRYYVIGEPEEAPSEVPEGQEDGEVRTDLPWADALWDSLVRSAAE